MLEESSKELPGTSAVLPTAVSPVTGHSGRVLAIVCPGQGAQTPGFLAPWLELPACADRLGALGEVAGLDLVTHGTTSPMDTIKDTAVAQPLLVAAGLVTYAALLDDVGAAARPDLLGGHSVGEVTAAAAAGVLTDEAAMGLVRERGLGMARAAAATPTGMSAVLGGDPAEVLDAIQRHGLTPANVNGAGQTVAAGTLDQLRALQEQPPARARVVPLPVAGAFHTEHMAPALAPLDEVAATLTPHDAAIPLVSNRDGEVLVDGGEVVRRIVTQVVSPVRWDLCLQTMLDRGVTALVEVCPGGTLTGLAKRAMRGVELCALRTPEDLESARRLLTEHAGAPAQVVA